MIGQEKNAVYELIGGPREVGDGRTNEVWNPVAANDQVGIGGGTGSNVQTRVTREVGLPVPFTTGIKVVGTAVPVSSTTIAGSWGRSGTSAGTGGVPVIGGQKIAVRASARLAALTSGTLGSLRIRVYWYTITGAAASIVSVIADDPGAPVVGQDINFSGLVTAPADAAFARLTLNPSVATIADYAIYFSGGMLTPVSASTTVVPPYRDGDKPGYYWTGTAHASQTAQDGTRAVLNNLTDSDYIGMITEITGLDSAEVIESFDDKIQDDGATHGDFFAGRRPVVLEGLIYDHGSIAVRNQRQTRLFTSARALRKNGVLRWTPTGGEEVYICYRQQQPTRSSGGWNKSVQVPIVADSPRIQSVTKYGASINAAGSGTAGRSYDRSYNVNFDWAPSRGNVAVTNTGNYGALPVITLKGDLDNPAIQNVTTERELSLNINMTSADTLVIDFANRTVTLNGVTSVYSAVNIPRSWWWELSPGVNTIQLLAAAFGGTPTMTVEWRNTWL